MCIDSYSFRSPAMDAITVGYRCNILHRTNNLYYEWESIHRAIDLDHLRTRITEPGETKHPEHAAAVNCESTLARRQDAFPPAPENSIIILQKKRVSRSSHRQTWGRTPPDEREEGRGNLGGNFTLPSPSENEGILSSGSIHKGLPG